LDHAGAEYALSYMDLTTGQFFVTKLSDFAAVCGEVRNLRARELVLGFDLTEDQQAIFGNQMNLLLSLEKEATEDIQLIDPS
ncbi:hypothetical protein ACXWOQ_09810, partial [Streptococcus pyogenes]